MGQLFGNDNSRIAIERNFGHQPVSVVAGPSHIGKMEFVSELARSRVHETDLFVADCSIGSAREAIQFAASRPAFSTTRVIIVDGAHSLSEPAQDAYLKLCEEPPDFLRLYFVAEDSDILLPALRSRFTQVHRWSRLRHEEILAFINADSLCPDEEAGHLCFGAPGLYRTIASSPGLKSLYREILSFFKGQSDPILTPTPEVLAELKEDLKRDSVINICRRAFSDMRASGIDCHKLLPLSNFASVLHRYPSANAEVYWARCLLV